MINRCYSFCIFIVIGLLSSQLDAQSSLPPSGSFWFHAYFGMVGYSGSSQLYLQNDTVINELNYKKLSDDLNYIGCLRSQDNQWLTIADGEVDEHILYDFNLAVGDTFWIDNPYFHPDDVVPYLVVDSIDLVTLLDGSERSRWHLEHDNWSYTQWIEGIGSTSSFLNVSGCYSIDCGWSELVCFSDNLQLVYESVPHQNSLQTFQGQYTYENCSIFLGHEELDPLFFSLYPNPTEQFLTVEISRPETSLLWNVLSVDGQTLLQGSLPAGTLNHRIELGALSSGVYFFQLEEPSRTKIRRFVLY